MPTSLNQVPHFTTPAQLHGNILYSMFLFYHKLCKSKIAEAMIRANVRLKAYGAGGKRSANRRILR
jgi:hypothetical protein